MTFHQEGCESAPTEVKSSRYTMLFSTSVIFAISRTYLVHDFFRLCHSRHRNAVSEQAAREHFATLTPTDKVTV
uniref:Uncharacterized protein n=1 Tax=Caenorhabditis japonica TaxID=281687 RepID=A0A8R1EE20_CAEJA